MVLLPFDFPDMDNEPYAQKFYWLQQQSNGAAAFLGLTVTFATLKMAASLMKASNRKLSNVFGGNDALIVVSLLAFFPIGICAISKCSRACV